MSYCAFDRNCNHEQFQNAVIFCWQPGPAKFAVQTYIVPDDSILKIVHGFFHICQLDLISHDSVHWSQSTFNKKDLVFLFLMFQKVITYHISKGKKTNQLFPFLKCQNSLQKICCPLYIFSNILLIWQLEFSKVKCF